MKKLILLGGGGHCESVIEVIRGLPEYEIKGILDPDYNTGMFDVLGIPAIGDDEQIPKLVGYGFEFVITVGQIKSYSLRGKLFERVKNSGGKLPIIKSKSAYVSENAAIGEGTVVMNQALINVNTKIGSCCIINSGSLIEHGCRIGDFTHISTKAVLNGEVNCGKECFIGSGAIINHGVSIGDKAVVASGSLVRKDVKESSMVAGNPVRYIR